MADTPNMNLPIPTTSMTSGPQWANQNTACFNAIDSHDHSTGKGVPITPAGMNINSELPMNGNDLTNANSVGLSDLVAALTSLVRSIQSVDGELYYVDGAGNAVQITLNGAVTGASGTITGLPSGTASASFAAGAFTFRSATNTPATMNVGPLKIGEQTTSPNLVTLESPTSLASAYTLTLPPAQGAAFSILTNNGSGSLSFATTIDSTILLPSLTAAGIGSIVTSTANTVSLVANTAKTITSISLTAGTWLVSATGLILGDGTLYSSGQLGINTSTNTFSGTTYGLSRVIFGPDAGSTNIALSIPSLPITIGSTTTYYLIMQCSSNVSGGGSGANATLTAVRVA